MPPAPDDQQRIDALKRYFVLDHEQHEDELTRLVRVAAELYGVAYAVLTLRDAESEHVAATFGFDADEVPAGAVFCERPVGPSLPLTVADVTDDARFAHNPLVHGPQAAKFYAGVPLKSSDGFTLGTLALLDPTPRELNGEGLSMLIDLGVLVEPTLSFQKARDAEAVANAQLKDTAEQLAAAEQALADERQRLAEVSKEAQESTAAAEHLATTKEQLADAKQEADMAKEQASEAKAELETVRQQLAELQTQFDETRHADADAQQRNEAAAQAIEATEKERDALRDERDAIVQQLSETSSALEEAREQLEATTSESGPLAERLAAIEAERDDAREKLAGITDALAATEARVAEAEAAQAAAEEAHDAAIAERDQAITERDAAIAERDSLETEQSEIIAARDQAVAERDAAVAVRDELAAERDAAVAKRDELLSERTAVRAERNTLATACDAAIAERAAAQAERDIAFRERDAAYEARDEALEARDARVETARSVAALLVDGAPLQDVLAHIALLVDARRAVLVAKEPDNGPVVQAAWQADGSEPLATLGDEIDASGLDAWAEARGIAHLGALQFSGGLVLFDAPAWDPKEEQALSAVLAPLAVALRREDATSVVSETAPSTPAAPSSTLVVDVSQATRRVLTDVLKHAEHLSGLTQGEGQQLAQTILGTSARLLRTLDATHVAAHLEQKPDALVSVNVSGAVEAALEPFRAQAEARDLAFFAAGTDLAAHAWADPSALHRVIDHLLTNAFTYTDQGGVRLRVHAEDDWVHIEVQDTGTGIPTARLASLFDGPTGADATPQRVPGTRLGLAVTKRLVDLMGGAISVTSLEGQGSVFRVSLRSAHAPNGAPAPQAAAVAQRTDA